MTENTVNWSRVAEGVERAKGRMIWKPYGLPEIIDPENSAFHSGGIQPAWDIPDKIIVQPAITGAFFTRHANPNQPITVDEIREQARACLLEGASAIHLHVRDDNGYNTLSQERFEAVVEPLREEFPDLSVDGCYVTALEGEWDEMKRCLNANILDGVPVNTTAVYNGDSLFAKPVPLLLEKTRLILESGSTPIIATYTDADVNNADRYLFRSGLLGSGQIWCVLPGLPGCSPMENPRQMIDGLMRFTSLIRDVDPEAKILVCAAGRASIYLATVAATLGLHIRVGMEDTVWKWPHKQEKLSSNLEAFRMAKQIVEALGREVATPAEYRQIMGLAPARSKV
ncbi:3-keto-5-aminohexanoate cleavage protein [Microbacterium rhizomatis]|uniref:3-keto-5-aminohexanoate cleavage protein n=1 Tax=Microbacterium rhizomatis TaxID=1631477 RepID=A0A5J5IXD9_9MICO|nr:3-keto-5-aminohexanoate cleavage protein [Microbacterium rhizomatis]KAA9105894.1 3-keto-5-aminohexanoate cleavage protein [Microbacterium rhizomatis]